MIIFGKDYLSTDLQNSAKDILPIARKFSKKDFLPTKMRFSFALEIATFKRLESSKKERLPQIFTVE